MDGFQPLPGSPIAAEGPCPFARPSAPTAAGNRRLSPTLIFWLVGVVIYGGVATYAAQGHFLNQTARDIWQHLAPLRELIARPFDPLNPFVPTHDPSRHFSPYWLSMALVARALGWNEWQAFALGGFVSAGVLLAGIYSFGRAFYRDPWGPLALLAAMVLGWILPVAHTGYHSMGALIDGIAYPAALLVGLSLNLWALVIRALEQPRLAWLALPLAALMFATHQLGAVIGFVAAGWLIVLWPHGSLRGRAAVSASLAAGIIVSTAWPYLNPLTAVLAPGNSRWPGGIDFYSAYFMIGAFIPQALGLLGLVHPDFRGVSRPILAALGTFLVFYAIGSFGPLIATRFLMPAVLLLHVGLGALLLVIARRWHQLSDRRKLSLVGAATLIICTYVGSSFMFLSWEARSARHDGSDSDSVLTLTKGIPDMQPVAAYDVAAWPMVATGQRALSEPWPEPGIPDLWARQDATNELFDPRLTRSQRIAVAKKWGVRSLVMHQRGAIHRGVPADLIPTLKRQSVRVEQAGNFLRFDLY